MPDPYVSVTPVFDQKPVDISRWDNIGDDIVDASTSEAQQVCKRIAEWLTQQYGKPMVCRLATLDKIARHEGKGFVVLTPGSIRDKDGKPVWDDSFRTRFRVTERNGAVAWNSMYVMFRPQELRELAQEKYAAKAHERMQKQVTSGADGGGQDIGGELGKVKVPIEPDEPQGKRGPGRPRKA